MECGLRCGIDTFFDMPNTNPPITSLALAEKRLMDGEKAEKELKRKGKDVRYHLYLGLTADEGQIEEMTKAYSSLFPRVVGLKLFASHSTGNMGIVEEEEQKRIWKTLSSLGYKGVVAVHAEKTSLFTQSPVHSLSRPAISEEESVKDQIAFASLSHFKGTLHIAHVSTKGALEEIERARKEGNIKITCGVTPHHALLSQERENGILKMNPPLRSEEDRSTIYKALLDGRIDWIESDHAPHTLQDKLDGKCGIPGFEGMARILRALRDDGVEEKRLLCLLSTNASRTFGIEESRTGIPNVDDKLIEELSKDYPFAPWA